MLREIVCVTLILSTHTTSSISSSNTTSKIPENSYQVTENIIDIPDDRTRAPIVPSYGINTPLNIGNSTIISSSGNIPNFGSYRPSNIVNSTNGIKNNTRNDTNESTSNLKKNSFSLLHIKVETDNYPPKNENGGIKRVFNGIKDYFYNIKKGVVDGLHNFFHKNDEKLEGKWREVESDDYRDETFDGERFNDEYDDDLKQEFEHY